MHFLERKNTAQEIKHTLWDFQYHTVTPESANSDTANTCIDHQCNVRPGSLQSPIHDLNQY